MGRLIEREIEIEGVGAQGNSPTIQFHQLGWFELNVLLFHWWVSEPFPFSKFNFFQSTQSISFNFVDELMVDEEMNEAEWRNERSEPRSSSANQSFLLSSSITSIYFIKLIVDWLKEIEEIDWICCACCRCSFANSISSISFNLSILLLNWKSWWNEDGMALSSRASAVDFVDCWNKNKIILFFFHSSTQSYSHNKEKKNFLFFNSIPFLYLVGLACPLAAARFLHKENKFSLIPELLVMGGGPP